MTNVFDRREKKTPKKKKKKLFNLIFVPTESNSRNIQKGDGHFYLTVINPRAVWRKKKREKVKIVKCLGKRWYMQKVDSSVGRATTRTPRSICDRRGDTLSGGKKKEIN